MEYKISKAEIVRRKKAYIRLSTSLIFGIYIGSTIFNFPTPLLLFILIFITLLIIGIISYKFFSDLEKIKIGLSKKTLQRKTERTTEEYMATDIGNVEIKRTAKKTIREIYLRLNDGRSVYITALDNFEKFTKELLKLISADAVIKEKNESLDFDHPLFYIFLGLLVGGGEVLIFKLISQLTYRNLIIMLSVFFVYLVVLGVYLVINKPISKRVGGKRS